MFIDEACALQKRFNCPKKINGNAGFGFTRRRANIRHLATKTTNALTENDFNAIGRITKQRVTQTSSDYRSTLSNHVECVHAAVTCMIPCVNVLRKDKFVIFALVLVILRKCASKRIGGRQLTP